MVARAEAMRMQPSMRALEFATRLGVPVRCRHRTTIALCLEQPMRGCFRILSALPRAAPDMERLFAQLVRLSG
eukprot:8810002-Alexandrium_andersonii.AAC.3